MAKHLKIQVLGEGLIPRGYGLAPRKEPFNADLTFIQTLLSTNGLELKYINPSTNQPAELTRTNLRKVWDKYSGAYENNTPVIMNPVDVPNNISKKPPFIGTDVIRSVVESNPSAPEVPQEVPDDEDHDTAEESNNEGNNEEVNPESEVSNDENPEPQTNEVVQEEEPKQETPQQVETQANESEKPAANNGMMKPINAPDRNNGNNGKYNNNHNKNNRK